MEGEKEKEAKGMWGGGGCVQKSAVISHETKAHSAQLWLVSHLEPSFQTSQASEARQKAAAAASCPAETRRGPAASPVLAPFSIHHASTLLSYSGWLAGWLAGALSCSCLSRA